MPWNYPLLMATWKLSPALAAGCAVVLKPDPQTPLTRAADRRARDARSASPLASINVVPGDGPTTGACLVRHPGVDKVAFTGSTETGGEIMRLASGPIKRITLELGGKSPNLVFADANLADAIPSSVWSIYYAAGQSCEARSRVLVEQPLYDEFVSPSPSRRGADPGGRPARRRDADGVADLEEHRERVHGCVERGAGEGAEVVTGGSPGRGRRARSIRRPCWPRSTTRCRSRRRRSSGRWSP